MARREQFTSSLKCPKCSAEGIATWEENENPVHSGGALNKTLESLSNGFERGLGKDSSGDTEILCSKCKITVSS